MAQSNHEIAAKIMQRMELTGKQKKRRRTHIISCITGTVFSLLIAVMLFIPWSMEAKSPIPAEASMLDGDPAAGQLILYGVIALSVGISVILLLRRKRKGKLTFKKTIERNW